VPVGSTDLRGAHGGYSGLALVAVGFDAPPPRKDRPVTFSLSSISCAADATKASASQVAAVSSGEITPSEAVEIGRLLENYVRTPEITELGQRLKKLEGIMSNEAN
jgi:hypothetical protein